MLSIAQLKPGIKFIFQNEPYEVLASNHLKLGRGGGIQQVKMKNMLTSSILNHNFKGNDKLAEASITNQNLQYLYSDNEKAYFMTESFETIEIDKSIVANKIEFLVEGQNTIGKFLDENLIDLEIPLKITFAVKHADPGIKGDRSSAGTKPVILENNLTVQAPLFIKTGDKIVLDTRTKSYIERAK